MNRDEQRDYVRYRISRAESTFADACLLFDNRSYNSAINRLYYACFYMINALFVCNDIHAQTHNGIKTLFLKHFVKTGIFDVESGKLYSRLFDWRQEADYSDFIDFDRDTAEEIIHRSKDLIETIKNYMTLHYPYINNP